MKYGSLIVLTGIDGAGKSTVAKHTVQALNDRGHTAEYVYGRFLPKLTYPIMELGRRTALTDTDIEEDYQDHQEQKQALFANKWVRRLYELGIMADYAPQLVARLALPLVRSEYVICDRYVYDTLLTDLSETVIQTPSDAVAKYRRYERVVPSPDYEFYVTVPLETSLERKSDIPSRAYLKRKKRFYDTFAAATGMRTLDGEMNPATLVDEVVATILTE